MDPAVPAPQTAITEAGQSTEAVVRAAVARVLGMPLGKLTDRDQPLWELGLDSLLAVELRATLERKLGRRLPIEALAERPTLANLVAALDAQGPAAPAAAPSNTDAVANLPDPGPLVPARELLEKRTAPLAALLDQARAAGVYHFEEPIEALEGQWVRTASGRRKLMFATYSYLGLLGHPRIGAAAMEAVQRYGTGTHGVRLNGGTLDLHKRLEDRIAKFLGREDAIVFSSGFMTNYGAISTMAQEGDWVIGDAWNHASIVDGCRASGATFRVYPHADMDALDRLLSEAPRQGLRLVVVDSLFSLDGDLVDLPRVVEVSRRHQALLMVDEAHSLGALGPNGRGIEDLFRTPGVIDVCMGTVS